MEKKNRTTLANIAKRFGYECQPAKHPRVVRTSYASEGKRGGRNISSFVLLAQLRLWNRSAGKWEGCFKAAEAHHRRAPRGEVSQEALHKLVCHRYGGLLF